MRVLHILYYTFLYYFLYYFSDILMSPKRSIVELVRKILLNEEFEPRKVTQRWQGLLSTANRNAKKRSNQQCETFDNDDETE